MSVHYVCEGCGVEVFGVGRSTVPAYGFCSTCEWLCTYVAGDLKEFWEIYEQIHPERRTGLMGGLAEAAVAEVPPALVRVPPQVPRGRVPPPAG